MGKTKSRANGDVDVFPRKNKAGRSRAFGARTSARTGSGATSLARRKRRHARRCGKPVPVRTRA
jgi:hypothetical protein